MGTLRSLQPAAQEVAAIRFSSSTTRILISCSRLPQERNSLQTTLGFDNQDGMKNQWLRLFIVAPLAAQNWVPTFADEFNGTSLDLSRAGLLTIRSV